LREAIDELLGKKPVTEVKQLDNKPVSKIDLSYVRFTDKLCPSGYQNKEIELPAKAMR
jgi:hypothetical protein